MDMRTEMAWNQPEKTKEPNTRPRKNGEKVGTRIGLV